MSSPPPPRSIFLTGQPRVGKSTIIKKIISYFQKNHSDKINLKGFYTIEVTNNDGNVDNYDYDKLTTTTFATKNHRIGFDVLTLDGNRGILARKKDYITTNNNLPRVGDYYVDITEFDRLALPSNSASSSTSLTITKNTKDDDDKIKVLNVTYENRIKLVDLIIKELEKSFILS
ncbi:1147_t:CDS:2 [Entrophospora sp. SA101]|nr:1147_t:CDS:2 [Entrophospora sp. SA101]CAJ0825814.1 1523_t:CDS:2 [Entrophospora sp. SA101]CAJ0890419.1 7134_t:CDS:2 [Entrophospora sp. SA101]